MKIFGIGLSRTGTKSLTAALNRLGFRIVHYPKDKKTYRELRDGKCDFSVLKKNDGMTDITVIPYYLNLDRLYPNSKFILTIRDKESWLESMEYHFKKNPPSHRLLDFLTERKIRRFLRMAVFGSLTFNREIFSQVYDSHHTNVLEYFKDRPHQLLILDILSGEGWEKLSPFLNKSVLNEEFPKI